MKIHKNDILQVDPIQPIQNSSHVCHSCFKFCKSLARGNHLRIQEW